MNLYSQNHGKKLSEEEEGSLSGEEDMSESESCSSAPDNGIEYEREPWYKVKYVKEKFSAEIINKMKNPSLPGDIKLGDPPKNILFPNDISILPSSESDPQSPTLLTNNEDMEAWNLKCTKFNVPIVIA